MITDTARCAEIRRNLSELIALMLLHIGPQLDDADRSLLMRTVIMLAGEAIAFFAALDAVREALGTDEENIEAILEIARNAHAAEQRLAALQRKIDEAL